MSSRAPSDQHARSVQPAGSVQPPGAASGPATIAAAGHGTPRNRTLQVAGMILPVVAAVAGLMVFIEQWEMPGLDFSVYWHGGKILNDARAQPAPELYGLTLAPAGGPELAFTYPPFAAILFSVLAQFPEPPGRLLFNAAGIAVAAWLAVVVVRYWRGKPTLRASLDSGRGRWAAVAVFLGTLMLGPWRETLAFGQINILLMGLILADLLSRHASWKGGFLIGVAAGIKLTPLVFGLYFLVRKDWGGLARMACGFAATVTVAWLLRPAESAQYWLRALTDTSRIGGPGYVDNLSIMGALLHFGVPAGSVTVPWLVLNIGVVVMAAAVIRAASAQGYRAAAISTTALAMLLASPVSWSHHWVWMLAVLPAFAWTLRELPARRRTLRVVMGAILVASLVVFYYSPKTIGTLLGASDLNVQTPGLWIMASSAGVFCGLAMMVAWLFALMPGRTADAPAEVSGRPRAR